MIVAGLSHIDIVSALPETFSELEFATDRLSLTPSKLRPRPYFPATHDGPFSNDAVLPFPEASAVVAPLPSLKPQAPTSPEGGAATV